MKSLKLYQRILRDGMGHLVWLCPQLETPTAVLIGRERRRDIKKVLVTQTDDRASHERTEGQRIQWIGNCANENQDVLKLLPPE
ncbi:hypothetical protein BOS5A_180064 [Bosea sp. EC-HK365B]|nr:hypothetical protein BOSE21B_80098 [Bosea sp. 21B]VVT57121.1 hypothetical protein BOS5A_180064 [Bosea sp. EC-HK365B]VXB49160.1 hypothetical protein BOSE127_120176 [Bosea sp. 127]VXC69539.1 hypothetical protein BOSE29B_70074 [Bosea sp. 29B]VXC73798.1 hypothetical protein BOSE125_450003 [Bosea sp. 125]